MSALTLGCVGILKDWLARGLSAAFRAAVRSNRRALERTALSIAQCEKILAEAREGEARLIETRECSSRLRCLLGLTEPALKTQDRDAVTSTNPARTRKPGVRSAQQLCDYLWLTLGLRSFPDTG
jgi:hypothetical protein